MDPLKVGAGERGAVRVFALAGTGGTSAAEWTEPDRAGWKLPDALGLETLGAQDVQVFEASDLAGMSLRQYLAEGYDIPAHELDAQSAALEAALSPAGGTGGGVIAVVRSAAIPDKPVVLTPARGIAFVGLFHEPAAAVSISEPESFDSARPRATAAASPPPDTPPRDTPEHEDDGACIVETIAPSREVYIRSHLWLAAAAMGGATAILYLLDNADYWVGIVAGIGAVAVRGVYLASEELGLRWELTETSLRGRSGEGALTRVVALRDVKTVRRLGSAVQIVTKTGDKLLMKYMAEPEAVQVRLARAAGVSL